MKDVLVTAYCLSYNHERYIKKTLEGFINQKTNFKYKVIVHDDASTDGSRQIIEEYAKNYPDIFCTIFQSENQYSQKKRIYETFVLPNISSRYVAVCEGDDYWISTDKLQKQVDYMDTHPDCSLYVHETKMIDEQGNDLGELFNGSRENRRYDTNSIILADGGGLFHTSSFMYRLEDRKNYPESYKIPRIGDYPLAIFLSTKGYVYYDASLLSAYRVGSINSWVAKQKKNKNSLINYYQNMIDGMHRINEETHGKYSEALLSVENKYIIQKSALEGNLLRQMKDKSIKKSFFKMTMKIRIRLLLKSFACKMGYMKQ